MLNNLREISDLLKKEGRFVIARAPYGSPRNLGSQTKGLRTVLAKANLVLQPKRVGECVGESQSRI